MLYPPGFHCSLLNTLLGTGFACCAFLVRVCPIPFDCTLSGKILCLCVFAYVHWRRLAGVEDIAGRNLKIVTKRVTRPDAAREQRASERPVGMAAT